VPRRGGKNLKIELKVKSWLVCYFSLSISPQTPEIKLPFCPQQLNKVTLHFPINYPNYLCPFQCPSSNRLKDCCQPDWRKFTWPPFETSSLRSVQKTNICCGHPIKSLKGNKQSVVPQPSGRVCAKQLCPLTPQHAISGINVADTITELSIGARRRRNMLDVCMLSPWKGFPINLSLVCSTFEQAHGVYVTL